MTDSIRVQVIAEKTFIAELKEAGKMDWEKVEDHTLPDTDQHFGIAEAAAIIVVVHSVAKLAETIVKVWKGTKIRSAVTIKTPKGSITIESDDNKIVEDLIEELRPIIS